MGLHTSIALTIAAVGLGVGTAPADEIHWEGQSWGMMFGSHAEVLTSGNLVVSRPLGWGAAHIDMTAEFRKAHTQVLRVGMVESPIRTEIWLEDDTITGPDKGGWVQFGAWRGTALFDGNYKLYYNDYDPDFADNGKIDFSAGVLINTGVFASYGEHEIELTLGPEGLSWTIDGVWGGLPGATFGPRGIGDTYLASYDGRGQFAAFSAMAVPTPHAAAMGAAGMALIGLRRRR